jgi:hypothetical protein
MKSKTVHDIVHAVILDSQDHVTKTDPRTPSIDRKRLGIFR